jgi:hypothetical protein
MLVINGMRFLVGPIMQVVGPELDRRAVTCESCDLGDEVTEFQLHDVIQSRPAKAAAGPDGWRTDDMKSLPAIAFRPLAEMWNLIETNQTALPKNFQVARLVIIPKPCAKSLQAIHKRLIFFFNVQCIAWSKARFIAMQKWLDKVIPKPSAGGKKGRDASEIYHRARVMCEESMQSNHPTIGVKLDRSKCFDLVCPQ